MRANKGRSTTRWFKRGLFGVLILIVVGVFGIAANTAAQYLGWPVERVSPGEISELLRPAYRIAKPEGPGPFPTALLFSGCDGPQSNIALWSDALVREGWAAILVDSHTPRGYEESDVWRFICGGQLFTGAERAGDVLVSIADARSMDFVDPDRLALIGMSHGGWSIMDLFAFDPPKRLPFNLTNIPDGLGEDPLSSVVATILVYPWCGPSNRARPEGWDHPAPVLFLLAIEDLIAPADDCLKVSETLQARGVPTTVEVFEDVTHAFDQVQRTPLTWLEFDQAATDAALARSGAFLREALKRAPVGARAALAEPE